MIIKNVNLTGEWLDVVTLLNIPTGSNIEIQNSTGGLLYVQMGLTAPTDFHSGKVINSLEEMSFNTSVEQPFLYIKGMGKIAITIEEVTEGSILAEIAAAETALASTVIHGKQLIGGAKDKWRDSFKSLDSEYWDYATGKHVNDYISLGGNTQGSSFASIILNCFSKNTVTEIAGKKYFETPFRIGYGASLSQRNFGEMTVITIAAVDAQGNRIINSGEVERYLEPSKSIKRIVVASNVAYITFEQPHDLRYDDFVVISGHPDTRINVAARVTQVRNKFMITMPLTIASAVYPVGNDCILTKVNFSKGTADCAGIAYYDNSSTNAVYFNRGQGSSEALSASTSFGTSCTDALVPSAQPYTVNLQPRFNTEIIGSMDVFRFGYTNTDSNSASSFYKKSQNLPDPSKTYAVFVDIISLPNRSIPIEIISVTKVGTTTATVTTKIPHGLQTGAYVRIYGSRDQTLFPNLVADTLATVTGESTLTVVWGAANTSTLYGGMIVPIQGGGSNGIINAAISGAAWYNGRLHVGITGTHGLVVGDVVRLMGVRDITNTERYNATERYRVIALNPNLQEESILTGASTTLGSAVIALTNTKSFPLGAYITGTGIATNSYVTAVTDNVNVTVAVAATATGANLYDVALVGVVLEPIAFTAPDDSQPTVFVSGGAIFRETELRLNFFRCLDYTRTPVEITGGHYTGDSSQSIPVMVVNSTLAAVQSSAAAIGTGTGAWVVRGASARNNDVVSAAITTTTTSTAIDNSVVNGAMQYSVDVTALTGTGVRMYTRIQESLDGGANWFTTYDLPPAINTTDKTLYTPPLPVVGTHVRYVRKIVGTTPSVTNAVWRTTRALENPNVERVLIDSTLGTLNTIVDSNDFLYIENCVKGKIVLTLPAGVTVAPAVKVKICDANPTDAASWYDCPGATLTGGVSSTQFSGEFSIPNAKFAKFSVTTGGVGVTADTYLLMLKAWN